LGRKADLHTELHKAEIAYDFPTVQKIFRVIDAETRTAVVSKSLQSRIRNYEPVDWRELQQHSVQIYADRVEGLRLEEASRHPGIFFWNLPYDEFLGYMAGVLPLIKGQLDGGFII
jgi:CRISPR-associated endonuclease/helicase Cas3